VSESAPLDKASGRLFVAALIDELSYDPNEDTAVVLDRVLSVLSMRLAALPSAVPDEIVGYANPDGSGEGNWSR
jgi:hypothetical protein